jgi:monoterpene epsilon-lactone hydrolase
MPSLLSRVLRFLQESASRDDGGEWNPIESRAALEKSIRIFPILKGTLMTPVDVDGITGEWLDRAGTPEDRVILYLHGGSFASGSINSHRFIVAPIVKEANTRTLMINYRLAPEHPFPAATEDGYTAYRWLMRQGFAPDRIIIMGDSAGGGLTLGTMLYAREQGTPMPAGGVGLAPAFDAALAGESCTTRQHRDFMLNAKKLREVILPGYIGKTDLRDPILSPIHADLHGLPPLLFHVGTDDILLSDSIMLAERAKAAGVDVTLKIWPGMWHVFQIHYVMGMPEARQSIREIGQWIRQRLSDKP